MKSQHNSAFFPYFPKSTDHRETVLKEAKTMIPHTIHCHIPLCPGDKISVQLLQVLRLGNWTTEVVDKDGSRAVGL